MLKQYRTDPTFLYRYYRDSSFALTALIAVLAGANLRFGRPSAVWALPLLLPLALNSVWGIALSVALLVVAFAYSGAAAFSPALLALVPLGIYFGMINVQLIHNCAHRSFRPAWLNRVLGELLAIHLLSGFPGFVILHLTHHRYPDDPERDPHPNGDLTFWAYFFGIKKKLRRFFHRTYFAQWGSGPECQRLWRRQQWLLPLSRVLRASVMLLLCGPGGFLFFIVPSLIANHLTYAHINYFTHRRQPDGRTEIVNLDRGFYRLLNVLLLGGYSHRDHHERPHLFNPAKHPREIS